MSDKNDEETEVEARLMDVLESLFCPMAGCWPLCGCRYALYNDPQRASYTLEVWPVGVVDLDDPDGNGDGRAEEDVFWEMAEFDFLALKELPLEDFHFSQQRSVFEIAWPEHGRRLELCIHIEPHQVCDGSA